VLDTVQTSNGRQADDTPSFVNAMVSWRYSTPRGPIIGPGRECESWSRRASRIAFGLVAIPAVNPAGDDMVLVKLPLVACSLAESGWRDGDCGWRCPRVE
jgi:hypothetical protein